MRGYCEKPKEKNAKPIFKHINIKKKGTNIFMYHFQTIKLFEKRYKASIKKEKEKRYKSFKYEPISKVILKFIKLCLFFIFIYMRLSYIRWFIISC